MNVDEWLEEADYLDPKDVPRSTSSLSVHTDASGTGVSRACISPPVPSQSYSSRFPVLRSVDAL